MTCLNKYKIQVVRGKRKWYWRIVYLNGRTLAHSEMYSSKAKARQTARNLAKNIIGCREEVYDAN